MDKDNRVNSYTHKIFKSVIASLKQVKNSLDIAVISRAVDLLSEAKKISFFDLGASATVVHHAINKCFRFNIPLVYSENIVLQRINCMNSSEGDVVVLISYIGSTKMLAELSALTQENNATLITITCPRSQLALDVPYVYGDDTAPGAVNFDRCSVTGFTIRHGEKFGYNLKRVNEALKNRA